MIKDWLESYKAKNQTEAVHALREIMQEVALAGLYRSGFFEKAAFYGGTALRIFHGIDRFSEDLDFSLLEPNIDFKLSNHLDAILHEFNALGMQVSIREKVKQIDSQIESAFLKSETIWRELLLEGVIPQHGLQNVANIKIKLEVDIDPPLGLETEEKLLLKPFSFYVKCFILPDLFAGKIHAILFRNWKTNVKGRDWYDLEWYIRKGTEINLNHFLARARNSGDLVQETITHDEFLGLLLSKISIVDFDRVKADIIRFIKNPEMVDLWSKQYFTDLIDHIQIKQPS